MLTEFDRRRGRNGRPWRRIVREVLVPGVCCAWCGAEIDTTLPRSSRWSGTVDHIIALADGGHPTDRANLQPMHRSCNSRKEAARRAGRAAEARQAAGRSRSSRRW
jgi:5-methylcytosine-specific restriction endonuclease McrA